MSDFDHRKTPKPEWLIQQEQCPSPTLDLHVIYSQPCYWTVDLKEKDPGMPAEDRLYLFDFLRNTQHLTELNLERCNLNSSHLKHLGDILAVNTSLRKLNLRDNNLNSDAVLNFLDQLEQYNYSLIELIIDEGEKTLEEKSRYLYESFNRGVVSNTVFANESEPEIFRNKIEPRVKAFIHWNRKYIDPLIQGGTHLELNFNERTLDKRGYPIPLARSKIAQLLKTYKNKIKSLTIDKWLPPPSLELQDEREAFEKLTKEEQEIVKAKYTLPDALFDLPNLEDLRFYNMVREDEEKDKTGKKRRIKSSFLTTLPPGIIRLRKLSNLTISSCGLRSIDGNLLPYLGQLTVLNLPLNKLKTLPYTIGHLKNLTRLSVHTNKLTELPDSILLLSKLDTLLAYDNYLTRLPVGIPLHLTKLRDFKALNQRNNALIEAAEADKELKAMAVRERAAIDKRPQPPFSELYNYLKASANGKVRLNRCKLVFVGDGNIGKTTTIRSLMNEATKKTKEEEEEDDDDPEVIERRRREAMNIATDGIEIHTMRVRSAGVKSTQGDLISGTADSIVFSCWDFAGQDIYYNTHQFFLSDRSIYLVGFNLEDEDESKSLARVEYWLQSINTRLPGVPIVIFGTHLESKKCTKDYLKAWEKKLTVRYKKRFKVIDIYFISNETGKGIPELLKGLKSIAKSKNFKKRLGIEEECPTSYLLLEERAHSLRVERLVPTMSYEQWRIIAKQDTNFTDEEVKDATHYLHDLGSLVWFDEDGLRDVVILDAQWLTQVFAATISAKTNLSTGILRHEDLPWLWRSYPRHLHPFMLTVLEKFELLHRLEGNAINNVQIGTKLLTHDNMFNTQVRVDDNTVSVGRSLIPCMLPATPPSQADLDLAWPPKDDTTTELVRIYRFEFLPNGFFSRMMVRLLHSQWQASLFWKYGIVLYKDLARLFLKHDVIKKEITIHVRGPDNGNKMGSLVESINTLISDWLKDTKIEITIPYRTPDGRVVEIPVPEVEKAVATGRNTVQVGKVNVSVESIAPDLAMSGAVAGATLTEADLNIGKELGRGGFAIVYRGTLNGEPVAVKKLMFSKEKEDSGETTFSEVFAEFRREVWLMSSLRHENIVSLKGIATKPNLCMVLEFMEGGNLYDYIHSDRKIDWDEKIKLALDVARGMRFMHGQNPPIIHRDLKTPNILLTRRGSGNYPTAKIADFGLSRGLVWTQSYNDKVVDNPVWLAPEVIQKKPYSEKVDVYAFGVILYEFASQKDFFGEVTFMSDLENRVIKGERPPIPEDTPDYVRALIEACWSNDPEKRPSFDQCVECLEKRVVLSRASPSIVKFTPPPIVSPQLKMSSSPSLIASSSANAIPSATATQTSTQQRELPRAQSAAPTANFVRSTTFTSAQPKGFQRTVSLAHTRAASVSTPNQGEPAAQANQQQPTAQVPQTVSSPAVPTSVPMTIPAPNVSLMAPLVSTPLFPFPTPQATAAQTTNATTTGQQQNGATANATPGSASTAAPQWNMQQISTFMTAMAKGMTPIMPTIPTNAGVQASVPNSSTVQTNPQIPLSVPLQTPTWPQQPQVQMPQMQTLHTQSAPSLQPPPAQ